MRHELLELWTAGNIPTKTILMVTHSIEEAVLLADRIVIMAKEPGRIVMDIPVTLSHPRQHKTAAFLSLVDQVYALLSAQRPPISRARLPQSPERSVPSEVSPQSPCMIWPVW